VTPLFSQAEKFEDPIVNLRGREGSHTIIQHFSSLFKGRKGKICLSGPEKGDGLSQGFPEKFKSANLAVGVEGGGRSLGLIIDFCERLESFDEGVHSLAGPCRDEVAEAGSVGGRGEIRLVPEKKNRSRGGIPQKAFGRRGIFRGGYPEDAVGMREGLPGLPDPFLFDPVLGGADPRRIKKNDIPKRKGEATFEKIPGRPGNGGDDGAVVPEDPVIKGGFPGIGKSGDKNAETVERFSRPPCESQVGGEGPVKFLQPVGKRFEREAGEIFFLSFGMVEESIKHGQNIQKLILDL
jgi:hypothetical protein